jgi:hypothetical protein
LISDQRAATLSNMLGRIESASLRLPVSRGMAIQKIIEAIQPSKSSTFRQGKSGGWREHFTAGHKRLFKDVAGELLIRLGYEENNDW